MMIDDWNPERGLMEGTFAEERDPELTEIERAAQERAARPPDEQEQASDI